MEGNRTCLGAGVINILGVHNVTACTSDRDKMTVVGLDHGREELLRHQEVRDGVDLKCLTDPRLWLIKYGRCRSNACIVDYDGWLAMIRTDGQCRCVDLGRRGDIRLVEGSVGGWTCSVTIANLNGEGQTYVGSWEPPRRERPPSHLSRQSVLRGAPRYHWILP